MPSKDATRPLIVKRKNVVGAGGHHGGAWKVAYADFVTAMMAFFLLMWLLNATTEDQRKGLADFFNPSIPISRTSAGGSGMLSGVTIFVPDNMAGSVEQGSRKKPTKEGPGEPSADETAKLTASPDGAPAVKSEAPASSSGESPPPRTATPATATEDVPDAAVDIEDELPEEDRPTDPQAARLRAIEQAEHDRLEEIRKKITEAMRNLKDDALGRHFILHISPEGLVIEIIDADDRPLFPSASATPAPVFELLADVLVPVLEETLNDLAIVGHTDAIPFGRKGYSNWELSADRANAARRLLIGRGLPESRVVRISGKAAVEPLVENPNAPQNRRIALILLRDPAR